MKKEILIDRWREGERERKLGLENVWYLERKE